MNKAMAAKTTDGNVVQLAHEQDKYKSALERLPHLTRSVTLMWASPELEGFISRLMMDSRDGVRAGLPMDVAAELQFLAKTNKIVRAIDLSKKTKVNLGEACRLVDAADDAAPGNDPWANSSIPKDVSKVDKGNPKPAVHRQLHADRRKKSKGLLRWLLG